MAHPRSFASFAAKIVPPTCSEKLLFIPFWGGRRKIVKNLKIQDLLLLMTLPGCGMGKELSAAQDNLEIVQQEVPISYKSKLDDNVKNTRLN